ncbi:MAG: four helix bundle protein [Bacteroidales bacterium]|nr:four helix bundle protein [Bacteroidales bacterium]
MTVKNYRELIVWQKSMTATTMLYSLVRKLPKEELFALSDQMRRCAVSIPSNIAEGQQRTSAAEFLKFISYAQGSRAELETQLQLCVSIGYLTEDDITDLMVLLEEINKMLSSLVKALTSSK